MPIWLSFWVRNIFFVGLSSSILLTCPSHPNCPCSIVSSMGIICNCSLNVVFLILSLFTFPRTDLKNPISMLFSLLVCLGFVVHHSHEYDAVGFTTFLITSTFVVTGTSFLSKTPSLEICMVFPFLLPFHLFYHLRFLCYSPLLLGI